MSNKSRFGTLLKRMRDERGLSARKFAQECGLNRETYRQYESGKVLPPNQGLMKILENCGLSPTSDEEGRSLVSALHEDRSCREPGSKRAFGVSANTALMKYLSGEQVSGEKINRVVDLFFEHLPTDRTDSMEHFIRMKLKQILES